MGLQETAEGVAGRFLVRESTTRTDRLVDEITNIDILLCLRGVEERSLAIYERLGPTAKHVCCPSFSAEDVQHASSLASDEVDKQLRIRQPSFRLKLGASTDYFANTDSLVSKLSTLVRKVRGETINVVMDISSLPKAYSCSLIGFLFGLDRSVRLRALYSEATYGVGLRSIAEVEPPEFPLSGLGQFTDGKWKLINLAHLPPALEARDGRKLVAFCGGDEDRLITALQQYDGIERSVMVAASDSGDSQSTAAERKASLCQFTPLGDGAITTIHPHRVVSALDRLDELCVTAAGKRSAFIMPFSTKPHALAAALYSLSTNGVSVVGRVPLVYRLRQATRTGRVLCYEILDLSSPHTGAYL